MDDSPNRFVGKASDLKVTKRSGQRIEEVYDRLRKAGGETAQSQLELSAEEVAHAFTETVSAMSEMPGRGPFHPKRERTLRELADDLAGRTPDVDQVSRTEQLQVWLGLPRWRVINDRELDFHYVDRELVPARVVAGGKPQLTEPKVRLDALLVNATRNDHTPVVAEIKIAGDANARLALIQALAAAAQLSPESQRRRFVEEYPDVFGSELPQRLDVYLIAHEPPAEGIRPKLLQQAVALTEELHADGSIGTRIRRLAFLETRMGEDGLVFERTQRWNFAATAPSSG